MAKLIINGGRPLKGTVNLAGAKNSSFKLMIASLLVRGKTTLKNLSAIDEVEHVSEIITALGGKVGPVVNRSVVIDTGGIKSWTVPKELGVKSRACILFLAPLLVRFGQAVVPFPGGDAIGKRPLKRHFDGLKALGVKLKIYPDRVEAEAPALSGTNYQFSKNSHTGTETMVMTAAMSSGRTVIKNAALEPEVDDLIAFLVKMGGKIKRDGRTIEIDGVKKLNPVEFPVMTDRNQAVSYAVAALATKGEVIVDNARADHLKTFLDKVRQAGGGVETGNRGVRFFYQKELRAVDIVTQPHPGFMTDWMPLWSVLMTQARGEAKVVEAVFTRRFQFVPALTRMGAKIEYFDPRPENPDRFYNFDLSDDEPGNHHGIKISGPSKLNGGAHEVFDIRAGATLAIAGLVARGRTVLNRAELIDRGYEDFAGQLAHLGAAIERV